MVGLVVVADDALVDSKEDHMSAKLDRNQGKQRITTTELVIIAVGAAATVVLLPLLLMLLGGV